MTTRATNNQQAARTGRGPRPAGKVITDKQIDDAIEGRYFIKANETGTLKLSGAPRYWTAQPNLVYNLAYRVVGTDQEIRDLLARSGYSQQDIDRSMQTDSITVNNFESSMAQLYNDELDQIQVVLDMKRQQSAESGPRLTLMDLDAIVTQLKTRPLPVGTAKAATRGRAASPKQDRTQSQSPRARGPRITLQDRLNSLKEGQSIDVSAIKEGGTGAKTMPTPAGKSKKVGVNGLNIISNNYASYALAISMLGPNYQNYANQYAQMYGQGPEAVVPAAAPSPRNRASPRAKGAPRKAAAKAAKAPAVRGKVPAKGAVSPGRTMGMTGSPGRTMGMTGSPTQGARQVTRPVTRVTGQVQPTQAPMMQQTFQPAVQTPVLNTMQQTPIAQVQPAVQGARRVMPTRGGVATGAQTGGRLQTILGNRTPRKD